MYLNDIALCNIVLSNKLQRISESVSALQDGTTVLTAN
jgi:hypothetical protein